MRLVRAHTDEKGIIAWFAGNHVAANLMMLFVVVVGLISAVSINKEVFPKFETNSIRITVAYLGAAPQEVEEGVILRVEEAIQDVNGIKKINSTANEGMGQVDLEIETGYDLNEVLDEVKGRIDAIATFPELTEKPIVEKLEFERDVIWISVYGEMDDKVRKTIANEVRDELQALPDVSIVKILGERDYEISIELSETRLREYGLTLGEVAATVRAASLDLPGGTIKTDRGDILLRTKGQAYTGREFSEIALRSYPDGTRLLLGDIATIRDGFVESESYALFNGIPAISIRVQSNGSQNVLRMEKEIKKYIEEKKSRLPDGISLDHWGNSAFYLKARLNMMLSNMAMGAVLVFIILTLFLRLRMAIWVIVGIPISFLGALWLMPLTPFPIEINLLTLFGFILVLGIVVDDAIVIGESIYTEITAKGHTLDNVIRGAKRVAMPATFGVLTSIAAFVPMLLVGGQVAPFFEAIGMVVILCLSFSLLESKLILPAHLVHMRFNAGDEELGQHPFARLQRYFSTGLKRFIADGYGPLLKKSLRNRYTTTAMFIALMIIAIGIVAGNLIKFEFFPNVPSDFIQARLTMNQGTATSARNDALTRIEQSINAVNEEYQREHPGENSLLQYVMVFTRGDLDGTILLELTKAETRHIDAFEIEKRWRKQVGEVAGAKEVRYFASTNAGGGAKINFIITGTNYEQMEQAAAELESKLGEYEGVFDIRNSYNRGSREIRLRIKPDAELLNLSMADLGQQVRQAFYGEEVQRIQRGRDELKVMVRYPRSERRSTADLRNMRIRTADGREIPFSDVAEVEYGTSFASITRIDRKRTISVTADADPKLVQSREVIKEISDSFMPQLLRKYPDVGYQLEGSSQEQEQLIRRIALFFGAALFLIYGLLAIPLHSYSQPFIIMSVIPFGFVGAIAGHILFGKSISMMSMFGLVALSGVIINDGLIMVDFVNKAREEGMSILDAVVQAGRQRFRAILLTTLTTFFGLMPIMFETSLQAQFVIPMALSLGFGILFGTIITLFMVPALYLILDDILTFINRVFAGNKVMEPE